MKKLTVIFTCMLLAFSLVACGSVSESGNDSENNSGLSNQVPGNNGEPDNSSSDTDKTEKKILVVYYSATGSTEKAANIIASAADADIFELTPVNEYSSEDLRWTDQNSRVVREHDDPSQRDVELVKNSVDNWNEYDTVFIGYPIWWGIAAWPVDGFIKSNDFTGKTVIPFCTSASSGLGNSGKLLADTAGTGNWLEGQRFSSGVSEQTVKDWVESLNLKK